MLETPEFVSTRVGLARAHGRPREDTPHGEIKLWGELAYPGSSDLSDYIKATRPAGLGAGSDMTGSQVLQSRGRKSQFCKWLLELQEECTDPLHVHALNLQTSIFLRDQGFI